MWAKARIVPRRFGRSCRQQVLLIKVEIRRHVACVIFPAGCSVGAKMSVIIFLALHEQNPSKRRCSPADAIQEILKHLRINAGLFCPVITPCRRVAGVYQVCETFKFAGYSTQVGRLQHVCCHESNVVRNGKLGHSPREPNHLPLWTCREDPSQRNCRRFQ